MDETDSDASRLEAARKQLDLVLGFFARAESRLSLVFAADLAMAGVLVTSAPPSDEYRWYMAIALVPLALLGWSIWQAYLGFFPHPQGCPGSPSSFPQAP